jgi:hypothetical protein
MLAGPMSKTRTFIQHVLPAIVKPARTLWNEIIGFVFIVLALWATPSAVRTFREFDGDAESLFRGAIISIFILVMAWFGFSSFRRARRISRS